MATITLDEQYGRSHHSRQPVREYAGELEFEFRDKNGRIIDTFREPNLVKIFAKEILAHRLAAPKIWDPNAGTGSGAWVSSGIDVLQDFAPRYIVFGASFDANHVPLNTGDARYYTLDPATNSYIAKSLGVGAEFGGGLINAIPISEPGRPLKRIESVRFETTYQPAGTPYLQDDVRAINNILVVETTLQLDEYNGFGTTSSDYFTITEVALVAGKELGAVGACEANPHQLFLEGHPNHLPLLATATGGPTITLNPSEASLVNVISAGDQVKIVQTDGTAGVTDHITQVTPYYLVISKAVGGSDIVLDRTPTHSDGTPITGSIGVFKDGFRIFSHRILKKPWQKTADFSVTARWRTVLG